MMFLPNTDDAHKTLVKEDISKYTNYVLEAYAMAQSSSLSRFHASTSKHSMFHDYSGHLTTVCPAQQLEI